MRWDYIFFVLFLYPVLKGLYIYLSGKTEYIRKKYKEKRDALTKEKWLINSSLKKIIYVTPYFGAYYYADFKYIWLTLGIIFIFTIFITLTTALISQSFRNEKPNEYNKVMKESGTSLKNVNFWPKWQVHALCVFNVSVLILWLYSWRHLYA